MRDASTRLMHRTQLKFAVLFALAALVVLIGTPIIIRGDIDPYILSLSQLPKTEVAVVLGASVAHGQPSPILSARANSAIALYKAGKVSKILVTGDNGA